MKHFDYLTEGTCSQLISLDLDGDTVHNVKFWGGCPGNLTAIPILVEGMTVEEIENKLGGVRCGSKPTSCAHQLTLACRAAYEAANA